MTTPQYKFFDTVKKEWSYKGHIWNDSIDDYYNDDCELFINENGDVCCSDWFSGQEIMPHITPVPFTGKFDRYTKPIYKHDILKETCLYNLIREVLWNQERCRFQLTNRVIDLSEWGDCEIIGSSLTNPELLDEK